MLRIKHVVVIGSGICLATIMSATIAIGFPSLPSSTPAANTGGGADAMQGALVTHFVAGETGVAQSQAKMAEAFGLTDAANKLNADVSAMSSGATTDNLGRVTASSDATAKQISDAISSGKELSADGKKSFSEALLGYAVGVAALRKLGPDYQNFVKAANQEISAAPITSVAQTKTKLQTGLYIGVNAPGYISGLASSSMDLLKYASAHNISVPKDATDALTGM